MKREGEGGRVDLLPICFLGPLGLLALVIFRPLITGFDYSLHNGTMLKAGGFVAADNYTALLKDADLWLALRFSLLFAIANVSAAASRPIT